MALESVEGNVLIRWDADTSAYRAEMSKLKGTIDEVDKKQKASHKSVMDQFDKQFSALRKGNDLIDEQGKRWSKVSKEGIDIVGQAVEKFNHKLHHVGEEVGKIAAGFAIGGVLEKAIEGLGEVLDTIAEDLVGAIPSDEEIEKQERFAKLYGILNDEMEQYFENARKINEVNAENSRVVQVLKDSQQELLDTLNMVPNAAEKALDKQLLLNKWVKEGTITQEQYNEALAATQKEMEGVEAAYNKMVGKFQEEFGPDIKYFTENERRKKEAARRAEERRKAMLPFIKMINAAVQDGQLRGGVDYGYEEEQQRRLEQEDLDAQANLARDLKAKFYAQVEESQQLAATQQREGRKSYLESVIGPLEQFDAYKIGFETVTGALTSAYDAVVEGNMSASQAVKTFLHQAIKGFGQQMLVRSVQELAEGFASLAWGPVGGASASAHFKAAALFAGGAALAGAIAGGIGSGGASASAASSASPVVTGASQGGGNTYNIAIGDSTGRTSPAFMSQQLRRDLALAGIPGASGPDSISWS